MNEIDRTYLRLLNDVRKNGVEKGDRTGTGTTSLFGKHFSMDVSMHNFPLLTCKKTMFHSIKHELLWFISGDSNVQIWDSWAGEDGDLGPVYGVQWRKGRDQLKYVIESLRTNPDSRRHVVSAWNSEELSEMALWPCHVLFQFYSRPHMYDNRRTLDIQVYQRSQDMFLGAPFNYASYALLLAMVAQVTGHSVGTMNYCIGDLHIYKNHEDQVDRLFDMHKENPFNYELPSLHLNEDIEDIDNFTGDDIEIRGYEHGPWIKAPIAV